MKSIMHTINHGDIRVVFTNLAVINGAPPWQACPLSAAPDHPGHVQ